MQYQRPAPRLTALALSALTLSAFTFGPAGPAAAHGGSDPAPPSLEPVLAATINTSAGGTGARLLLGDVSGDGRLDIVTMQPTYSADDRYIGRQVQALTAFDLSGGQLWQIGTPDPRVTNNGTDIPAEIYDIDGDGDNDVLAVMDSEFRIFEGSTGALTRAFPLPHPEAHDSIIIANLRGTDRPRDIVLKDRYNQLWALDSAGNTLWTHIGTTGHRPYPHDFTGDGRQEFLGGYDFLDPDGNLQWSADMADHPDSIAVGDVDGDGREDIAFGGAGLGGDSTNVYRSDGTLLWRNFDAVEAQQIGFGDFRPDLPGLETVGLDRVDRTTATGKDSIYLVSSAGETLWKETRTTLGCWGSVVEPLRNWDGRYSDLILTWNRGCGEIAGIFDGYGNRVATFPIDGRMVRGDLCGDDRYEVVDYVMGQTANVYGNGPCDLDAKVTGSPLPQAKIHYNYTRYTAEEIPGNHALDRRTRASSDQRHHGSSLGNDGDARTSWTAGPRDRHPSWRVDLGAIRELTGVRVTFRQHKLRYKVETSLDGRHWTVAVNRIARSSVDEQWFTGLARYVRVSGTAAHGAQFGFAEFEVLGTR